MTATTRHRLRKPIRILFVTTLLVFLALAVLLVATQVIGVLLLRPGVVTGASDVLLLPSITAAVVFGLVAFAGSYLPDSGPGDAQD